MINRKYTYLLPIFILISLVALSIPARTWGLTRLPPVIVDEPANIRDINTLLSFGQFHPIDFEWGFGQASLVHYPAIFLIKSGITNRLLALRLTSAMLSILSIIPFFFIVKRYTSDLVAWCTSILFSSSYYFLQFSRVGWTNIHALCFGLYFLWISHLASCKRSWILTGVAGILGGVLFYTYRAAELYIAFGSIIFIVTLLSHRYYRRASSYGLIVLFMISMSLIAYPWVHTISNNWERYTLRARVVSVFNANRPYHSLTRPSDIIGYQIDQTIRSWILFLPMHTANIENIRYIPQGYSALSIGNRILF